MESSQINGNFSFVALLSSKAKSKNRIQPIKHDTKIRITQKNT